MCCSSELPKLTPQTTRLKETRRRRRLPEVGIREGNSGRKKTSRVFDVETKEKKERPKFLPSFYYKHHWIFYSLTYLAPTRAGMYAATSPCHPLSDQELQPRITGNKPHFVSRVAARSLWNAVLISVLTAPLHLHQAVSTLRYTIHYSVAMVEDVTQETE